MSDYISREAASADEYKHKIKTPFAKIIVGGTPEKPCYDILYFDPTDGKCHIGFGSYRLDYVFRWLAEEFEVTEPCADVELVRHSYWESYDTSQYMGTDEFGELKWRPGRFYICHNRRCRRKTVVKSNYCPNCGEKMDLEDDNGT